jgi:hypothetical protein
MERNYQSPARFRHAAVVILPPRSISPDPTPAIVGISPPFLPSSLSLPHSRFLVFVPLRYTRMHVECIVRLHAALPVRRCALVYVRARIQATGRSKIPGFGTIQVVESIGRINVVRRRISLSTRLPRSIGIASGKKVEIPSRPGQAAVHANEMLSRARIQTDLASAIAQVPNANKDKRAFGQSGDNGIKVDSRRIPGRPVFIRGTCNAHMLLLPAGLLAWERRA